MSGGKRAKPRKRRRAATSERPPSARPRRKPPRLGSVVAFALAALVAFSVAYGASWISVPHEGSARFVEVTWPEDPGEGTLRLAAAGVVDRPFLFRALLRVASPFVKPAPGPHLLAGNLTPAETLRRLARLTSRARARVVVPEGFNRFQLAERLEQLGVCSARAFGDAASSRSTLEPLGVAGDSAEGYLFPATYDLFEDSAARAIVEEMVREAKKRLALERSRHEAAFAKLQTELGWGEREILTLASVVEREAARPEERPVIASVFWNRLMSPDFRPARHLQSDPTAAYGCLVAPALASCQGTAGRVTPAMLRDPGNPYNTYRHPGLPPGPISNPGLPAVLAVLEPAATEFLFFVSAGDGRHTFSRTLDEHEAAIRRGQ